MAGNSQRIPDFIKATSPQGLVRLMLENNLKRSTQFEYQIVHDGKSWFAWYYIIKDNKEVMTNALQNSNAR